MEYGSSARCAVGSLLGRTSSVGACQLFAERSKSSPGGVKLKVRGRVDVQAFCDVARIEASALHETHKSAKKVGARRRQAACRLRRRRLALDDAYDQAGVMLSSATQIGAEMFALLDERPVDLHIQASVLDYVAPQSAVQQWRWPQGEWRADLVARPPLDSTVYHMHTGMRCPKRVGHDHRRRRRPHVERGPRS